MVKDIRVGSKSSNPYSLTNVNGTLFFHVLDEFGQGVDGHRLWKSDGTATGTVGVDDLSHGNSIGAVREFTDVNGMLFFSSSGSLVKNSIVKSGLWKSDGTPTGTVLVKEFTKGREPEPKGLLNVNGTLYFIANTDWSSISRIIGEELWRSDGTAVGTRLVKEFTLGSGVMGEGPQHSRYLTNVNGMLFFAVNHGVTGMELWKSDGTAAGTVLVKDIHTGSESSFPNHLVNFNGTLFFFADDGVHGSELWKSDGTAAGTVLVKDIWPGTSNSIIVGSNFGQPFVELIKVNGSLFFDANDGVHGRELWKSDGTAAGTVLVKDIFPGSHLASVGTLPNDTILSNLTNVNGTLFFVAHVPPSVTAGSTVPGLWKSDGTAIGTVLLKNTWPAFLHGVQAPNELTNVNGTLFFATDSGPFFSSSVPVKDRELWKSDGTAAGTVRVKDIWPGDGSVRSGSPRSLTNVNGTLFFSADDGVHGRELWSVTGSSPRIVDSHDVNGDGKADLVWRNTSTGSTAIWLMNGVAIASTGFPGGVPLNWQIAAIGDVNGDGRADVIWRHATTGAVAVWLMNGMTVTATGFPGGAPVGWALAGTGDLNGDGQSDLVWRNSNSGAVAVWLMNGTQIADTGFPGGVPVTWQIAGVGDVNGDGKADVLWRNRTNGLVAVWVMNGRTVTSVGFPGSAPTEWAIAELGDVNGDGKADVLWRNTNSGAVAVWLMNGTTRASSGFFAGKALEWAIAQVGDVDGDGKADVIWRNTSTGVVEVWLMNGLAIASTGSPGVTSTDWEIQ